MKLIPTPLPDLFVLEPLIHKDSRGIFFEVYNEKTFYKLTGVKTVFVQDNHSSSLYGVIRGLHYQVPPKAQGKLVRVIQGEIWDVAVDLRASSNTLGKWFGIYLSAENKKQLWIPDGFAHGFMSLSNEAEVSYKVTDYYDPMAERCLAWNDATIGIKWPKLDNTLVSPKDAQGDIFDNCICHI